MLGLLLAAGIVLSPGDDIGAACDRLRRGRSRAGRAEIVLRDGYYAVTNAIILGELDSRLTIRAEHPGQAFVTAAEIVPGRSFRRDGKFVRAKVGAVTHLMLTNAVRPVLSVDGVALTHARWPDVGGLPVTDTTIAADKKGLVLADGRAGKWTLDGAKIECFGMTGQYASGGRLVTGYDAATKTLRFKDPIDKGMRFFVHGVLEEIDRPGEWAYDAKAGEIVMLPPDGFSSKSMVAIGCSNRGLFRVTGDEVRFVGIVFTAVPWCKGQAIAFDKGSKCGVVGCRFTAFGGEIVRLGGRRGLARSCDFVDNYACCVRVDGGDKKLLEPGENVVDNCLFTRPCLMREVWACGAVRLDGVENRVSHCVIHDTREHALDWSGFGCIVEYCRMFDANLEFRDSGVVYSPGLGASSYGCHFRFNDISGSPGLSHGIYPDDFSSGHLIYGNVVRNVGWGGIFLGGGRNNLVSNNVISATGVMALHNDNRGLFWPAWKDREKWHQDAVRQIDYVDGPIGKRWPEFARWREDGTNMFGNIDNVWVNNVVIDSGNTQDQVCNNLFIPKDRQVSCGNVSFGLRKAPCKDVWRFGGFKTVDLRTTPNRLFVNVPPWRTMTRTDGVQLFRYERGDFNLAENSELCKEMPGFVPIPWDKIGLYVDAWRKTLPVLEPLDYAASTGGSGNAGSELIRVKAKDFGTVAVKEAGLHNCWAKVRAGTSVKVSVAGENFTAKATGKKDAIVWVRVGEVMLPAGYTTVSASKGDVEEMVLASDPKWTPGNRVTAGLCAQGANLQRLPAYEQEIEVRFANPADAAKAKVSVAPLPDAAEVAVCTRWDDSNPKHAEKGKMLLEAGMGGTFYLTGDPKGVGQATLDVVRGSSGRLTFGNHSLTHDILGKMVNGQWAEFMRQRVAVEDFGNMTCNAFAFPMGPSNDPKHGRMLAASDQWVVTENPQPLLAPEENRFYYTTLNYLTDNKPSGEEFTNRFLIAVEKAKRNPKVARAQYGVHSWCDEKGNALQGALLKSAFAAHHEWTTMSDTAFGAYRYEYFNGQVENAGKGRFKVRRFDPARLGAEVPLSLAIEPQPNAVLCGGRKLARGSRGTWTLPHDKGFALVSAVGRSDERGVSAEVRELQMSLEPDEAAAKVGVSLTNVGTKPLKRLYVSIHLPPMWNGCERMAFEVPSVRPGETVGKTLDLAKLPRQSRADYRLGGAYYAAAADFTVEGVRKRLWAEKTEQHPWFEKGCSPAATALNLGPVAAVSVDFAAMIAMSAPTATLKDLGTGLNEKWSVRSKPTDSPEIVQTLWPWGWKPYFDKDYNAVIDALHQRVGRKTVRFSVLDFDCETAGKIRIDAWGSEGTEVEAVYLNGKEHPLKDTATLAVRAGRNRMIVRAYIPPPLGRNFRSFSLLVTDARTGAPVKTVPIEK